MQLTSRAIDSVKSYLLSLQSSLCSSLEAQDETAKFDTDTWQRPLGGSGITKVLQKGRVFAKAGVNFSHVFGVSLPPAATVERPQLVGRHFHAMGVSVVLHPENPFVPTTHLNVRFFLAEKVSAPPCWWFGGGFDLTPYYGFEEDCYHWHITAKEACDPFGEHLYPLFKERCDSYFFLPHRQEARGIGGLFFDDFCQEDFTYSFAFLQSVGDSFSKAYLPLVVRRKDHPFQQRHKDFQCYRRGRYVEFNLLYDRGTLFGLQSQGRTESILMSLPPDVHWQYNWHPEKGSEEERLYTDFLPKKDWLA